MVDEWLTDRLRAMREEATPEQLTALIEAQNRIYELHELRAEVTALKAEHKQATEAIDGALRALTYYRAPTR